MGADGPRILALDQGTSSSRAIVFDGRGCALGRGQVAVPCLYPRPGWVEQDPEAIWSSQLEAARQALRAAGVAPREVAAVGIANQRETTVAWRRSDGRPLHAAIVWQDRRTAALVAEAAAGGWEAVWRARTGLVADPYFSAPKMAWLLREVPAVAEAARAGDLCFGTVDAWLLWRLTGGRVHRTEATNACRTLLFDIHRLAWDDELLGRFGVPRDCLPEVCATSGPLARADPEVLGAPVPVTALVGDQQASLFAQACRRPGTAKCTYGTGCFLLAPVAGPTEPPPGLVGTVAEGTGRDGRLEAASYAVEGSVFAAGAAVDWLCRVGLARDAGEVYALAAAVPDPGGVCFVPAFAGLGAPHWDPGARGALLGLTLGTGRAHIARAAVEAIAHQVREVALRAAACLPAGLVELRADGGGAAADLLLQLQADLLGVPVVRSAEQETTALGAALLAGLAAGVWRDREEAAATWRAGARFQGRLSAAERERAAERWGEAVRRAGAWVPAR